MLLTKYLNCTNLAFQNNPHDLDKKKSRMND